ncbi:MAG: oligosaccharide flippase family protein [Candidatus Mcinerneyibacterium aminivorans]|uniref:Oligosaccharide flippase family protein n=1 Tax=Candidatus Mcinerneyibacterium aminivorans TaxID=2703815 RepID=A0A5D0MKW7_9BACT|nr:MAG: oligosaccharide flippase family protein [Candidatus Mcinerneyibacterium aminivorans]
MDFSYKKLLKGTSIYTFSFIFIRAGSILLLPVFTRLLTPSEYGIIGILKPIINFVPLFFVFGLYVAQMRKYNKYKCNEKKLGNYIFSLNLFLWIINVLLFLLLISPLGKILIGKIISYNKVGFYPYVFLALLVGFLKIFTLMARNYFQTIHDFNKIAISSIVSFVCSAGFAIILIHYFNLGALGKILGMLFGTSIVFSFLYIGYIKKANFKFNKNMVKESLIIGVPVMANSIIGIVINYSDRIVLGKFLSMEVVGIYSLAYTGGMVLLVFTESFLKVWTPMFYDLLDSANEKKYIIIKKTFKRFIIISLLLYLFGSLFGKEIIHLCLPQNYNNTYLFLPYILFAMVFGGIVHFLGKFFVYFNDTKLIPIFTLISAICNLVINIIFVPIHGAFVAAISTIISFLITSVIMFIIIEKKYKSVQFDYLKIIFIIFLSFNPITLFLYQSDITLNNFFLKLLYLIIYLALFFKEIKKIYISLKK